MYSYIAIHRLSDELDRRNPADPDPHPKI
jgi:hypothetical protein